MPLSKLPFQFRHQLIGLFTLVVLSLFLTGQHSLAELTLIGPGERNGSFEDGKLGPWRVSNLKATVTDAEIPGPTEGVYYANVELKPKTDETRIWGRLYQAKIQSSSANGKTFTLSLDVGNDEEGESFDRVVAILVFYPHDETARYMGSKMLMNKQLSSYPEELTSSVEVNFDDWGRFELRIEFLQENSGGSDIIYKASLDNVRLVQSITGEE